MVGLCWLFSRLRLHEMLSPKLPGSRPCQRRYLRICERHRRRFAIYFGPVAWTSHTYKNHAAQAAILLISRLARVLVNQGNKTAAEAAPVTCFLDSYP